MKDNSVKPSLILLSLISIMVLLLLLMFVFPEDGIDLGVAKLKYPTTSEFFDYKNDSKIVEIDSLEIKKDDINSPIDSTSIVKKDTAQIKKSKKVDTIHLNTALDSLRKQRKSIQGNKAAIKSLTPFFKSLNNSSKEKIRIVHYGDSQIESDRITSYIRNVLQKRFGGSGVGLFPVITVSQKWTLNNKRSKNWKRYAGFGRKNNPIPHKKFGTELSFCRFTPYGAEVNDEEVEGWVSINKSKLAYARVRQFSQFNMYLNSNSQPVSYKIISDNDTIKSGVIKANTHFTKINTSFSKTPEEVKIVFKSKESPNVYGMSLESNSGIIMDNIPLRGSSGTNFTKQDRELLRNMFDSMKPKLLILQFGGNTIPYTKSIKQANNYGNWFKQQLKYFKKLLPGVPIIVIGPSDMSYKNKTEFQTYPYLEAVRNALLEATISSDCLYWDMYTAMGGKNSMPKWVNSSPALANKDYIHFSSKGSVKIAKMFSTELLKLYDAYKGTHK